MRYSSFRFRVLQKKVPTVGFNLLKGVDKNKHKGCKPTREGHKEGRLNCTIIAGDSQDNDTGTAL